MRPLKISAISFLNTAPLMWDFEHQPSAKLTNNFEIQYTVPSRCAVELQTERADIGLVPVITTAIIPGLVIVPDVAIAAQNEVRSILLVSKVPIERIKSVAADTSSRTSVALTVIALRKFFDCDPELTPMPPVLKPMLERCDAALLIGDPAMTTDTQSYYVYDLAQIWRQQTGKPFVFAVWAVREQALKECDSTLDVARIFQQSRDRGLEKFSVSELTREWSQKMKLPPEMIEHYLRKNIYYQLDSPCLDGLALYFSYAAELGLIASVPELRFL